MAVEMEEKGVIKKDLVKNSCPTLCFIMIIGR